MKTVGVIEIVDHRARLTVFQPSGDELRQTSTQECLLEDLSPVEGVSDYVLVLPDDKVHIRFLELPFTEEDKLKEVVPFELRDLTTYRPEEIVFSAVSTGPEGQVVVGFTEKAYLEDILNTLQQQGIEVQRVSSLELFQALKETEGSFIEQADNTSLLREELLDRRIDFLQGTVGYERKLRHYREFFTALLRLVLVVLVGSGTLLFFKWYPLMAETRRLEQRKIELFKKAKPNSRAVAPVYQLKAEIKHLQEELNTLVHVEPLEVFARLSEVWPDEVQAEQIEIKPGVVLIKGYAEDLHQIESLKEALQKVFSEVKVVESEKAGQVMRYTIEVKR